MSFRTLPVILLVALFTASCGKKGDDKASSLGDPGDDCSPPASECVDNTRYHCPSTGPDLNTVAVEECGADATCIDLDPWGSVCARGGEPHPACEGESGVDCITTGSEPICLSSHFVGSRECETDMECSAGRCLPPLAEISIECTVDEGLKLSKGCWQNRILGCQNGLVHVGQDCNAIIEGSTCWQGMGIAVCLEDTDPDEECEGVEDGVVKCLGLKSGAVCIDGRLGPAFPCDSCQGDACFIEDF